MQPKWSLFALLIGVIVAVFSATLPAHAQIQPPRHTGGVGFSTQPQVAGGDFFTCALQANGTVECWGYNAFGVLGVEDSTLSSSPTPLAIAGVSNAVAIGVGIYHACALIDDGTILCWGGNQNGQGGNGTFDDSHIPAPVSNITNAVAIGVGHYHTCAVLADGSAACWGENEDLQSGHNTGSQSDLPIAVAGLSNAVAIAAGRAHTCALQAAGTVQCWGWDAYGQLGDGTMDSGRHTPEVVAGIGRAKALEAGEHFNCALLDVGEVRCWGNNEAGQLGNGSTTSSAVIVIPDIDNVAGIALGWEHVCAKLADGTLKCWGDNGEGKAIGTTAGDVYNLEEPTVVNGVSNVAQMGLGRSHSCVVLASGTMVCWGNNEDGQLGLNTTTGEEPPTQTLFNPVLAPVKLAAGGSHVCALFSTGYVRCWGSNQFSQLASPPSSHSLVPVTITGLSNVIDIAAGQHHTCALTSAGQVYCWGRNNTAQTGQPLASALVQTPTLVSSLSDVIAVEAGHQHSCVLLADGNARCWGNNSVGEVGNNTSGNIIATPALVITPKQFMSLALGGAHSCGRTWSGEVYCWGSNAHGQLGDGDSPNAKPVATLVGGLANPVSLALGGNHTCALLVDGSVACWGIDNGGQLGQGGPIPGSDFDTPTTVVSLTNATTLTAGVAHNCVRTDTGTAQCWGLNTFGQVGDNTVTSKSIPTTVFLSTRISALSAGHFFTCARWAEVEIRCWGWNEHGQIGQPSIGGTYSTPNSVGGVLDNLFGVYLPLLRR